MTAATLRPCSPVTFNLISPCYVSRAGHLCLLFLVFFVILNLPENAHARISTSSSSSSPLSFFFNGQPSLTSKTTTTIHKDSSSPPSTSPSTSSKTPVHIPLSGGLLHASGFFFNATVGNQPFTLQVDLSYSSLIIPSHHCKGCRIGDRRYNPDVSRTSHPIQCSDSQCHSTHDPVCTSTVTSSSRSRCFNCTPRGRCCSHLPDLTSSCAFNVVYGDSSSGNGTVYTDNLAIGNFNISNNGMIDTNVLFGSMHEESHNFEMPYADGVFGLAFRNGSCKPTCFPTLMDQITNSTSLPNIFTLCVSRYGGTLVLGEASTKLTKPNEEFSYVDVVDDYKENRFIIPAVPKWQVNDKSIDMPGITKAMWTAGFSNVGLSKTSFLALLEHLMKYYCDIPGLCSTSSWFRPQHCTPITDEVLQKLPNITIPFTQRVNIILTPEDYLLPYRIVHGKQYRCVAFIIADHLASRGIGLLLGSSVFRRYAVAFDRNSKRVGVAPAAGSPICGPATGNDEGLASSPGNAGNVLTADAPAAPPITYDEYGINEEEDTNKREEECRAIEGCSSCAKNSNCSYGYETGRCVPLLDASMRPYPYCQGSFCACFAIGKGGWYFGIGLGVLLCLALVIASLMIWKKRQQQNFYRSVNAFEEQDLETF